MRARQRALWQISLLAILSVANLSSCQAANSSTKPSTPTATETSTLVLPSPSPSPSPSALPTEATASPTATATLASYPDLESASKKATPFILRPANFDSPLALSANDHFYFSYPLPAASLERTIPSGRYGSIPGAVNKGAHTGLDVAVDIGTAVLAAGPGTVVWTGIGLYNNYENEEDPYGVAIAIRHDYGYEGERLYTVYAHLSESLVVKGQRVTTGETIGLSGNTGFSSGPHLHFEVRVGANTIYHSRNPELWIAPPENSGVLVAQIFTTFDKRVENQALQITNLESGKVLWVFSYATDLNVITDAYYDENFVLSDMPAGRYEVAVPYVISVQRMEIEIRPGAVSYFYFHGYDGFTYTLPSVAPPPHLPNN